MARHRGKFDPNNPEPYELSRSRIENFVRCRACFWLEQLHKVKPPEMPSFTINTTTDILLKRDADKVRGKSSLLLWEALGLGHMIPFEHEDLDKWTNSMQYGLNDRYFNTVHKETNIKLGGGLDDVFLNTDTGQIHIVDYKSEAQGTGSPEKYVPVPSSIDKPWKDGYKRQMDMYVWIARRKGFDVSDIGYFVYVDARHKGKSGMLSKSEFNKANMEFTASIIPYHADPGWVEPILYEVKDFLLNQAECPLHAEPTDGNPYSGCDKGRYIGEVLSALSEQGLK